mmetsp:Transcript_66601/g.134251  ORF Transcript_66601/g.134251 Transcript_66601/m.134251 type:complete len:223 (+) Transcript_66601:2262-2930(+)
MRWSTSLATGSSCTSLSISSLSACRHAAYRLSVRGCPGSNRAISKSATPAASRKYRGCCTTALMLVLLNAHTSCALRRLWSTEDKHVITSARSTPTSFQPSSCGGASSVCCWRPSKARYDNSSAESSSHLRRFTSAAVERKNFSSTAASAPSANSFFTKMRAMITESVVPGLFPSTLSKCMRSTSSPRCLKSMSTFFSAVRGTLLVRASFTHHPFLILDPMS